MQLNFDTLAAALKPADVAPPSPAPETGSAAGQAFVTHLQQARRQPRDERESSPRAPGSEDRSSPQARQSDQPSPAEVKQPAATAAATAQPAEASAAAHCEEAEASADSSTVETGNDEPASVDGPPPVVDPSAALATGAPAVVEAAAAPPSAAQPTSEGQGPDSPAPKPAATAVVVDAPQPEPATRTAADSALAPRGKTPETATAPPAEAAIDPSARIEVTVRATATVDQRDGPAAVANPTSAAPPVSPTGKQSEAVASAEGGAAGEPTTSVTTPPHAIVAESPQGEGSSEKKSRPKSGEAARRGASTEAAIEQGQATDAAASPAPQQVADMQLSAPETTNTGESPSAPASVPTANAPSAPTVAAAPPAPPPAAPGGSERVPAPLGRSAAAHDGGSNATEADRVRFVQRVTRAFEAARERGGPVRLRLSPPELGALKLELTVRDGVLNARVEAETPAARSLLMEGLPGLRDRLAAQDLRVERFDVELMDRSPDQSPQPREQRHDAESHPGGRPAPRRTNPAAAVSVAGNVAARPPRLGDGQLNIVI